MTRTALSRMCLSTLLLVASAGVGAAELQVTVHEIRAQTGTLNIALVSSADGWDGKAKPLQARSVTPTGTQQAFTFTDLPAGDYGVLVTHDENGNGKLDTNLLGMPLEGYGFSNNPKVMRKPTFDEARIHVPATGTAIDITLR